MPVIFRHIIETTLTFFDATNPFKTKLLKQFYIVPEKNNSNIVDAEKVKKVGDSQTDFFYHDFLLYTVSIVAENYLAPCMSSLPFFILREEPNLHWVSVP